MAEIYFMGSEFEGAKQELGNLADKLSVIADDAAVAKFGAQALRDPTDIQILPVIIEGEPTFIATAWHETASKPHASGRIGLFDFTFQPEMDGEEAFLKIDDSKRYLLTTREALLINDLAAVSLLNTLSAHITDEY